MEKRYEEREARIAAAQILIKGLRKGICPCGYMGTISPKGHCFKCGTQWDIYPTAAATGQPQAQANITEMQEAGRVILDLCTALESLADVEGKAPDAVKLAWNNGCRWMAGAQPQAQERPSARPMDLAAIDDVFRSRYGQQSWTAAVAGWARIRSLVAPKQGGEA
jgi:hypothetical protein